MDTATIIIIVIIALAIGAAAAVIIMQRLRSKTLQTRFGPEYGRTVSEATSRSEAEARLVRREKRVRSYSIHALAPEDRAMFNTKWRKVQTAFVDDPSAAVSEADTLLGEVMLARGYPVNDFDRQAADLSVDHPVVVQNYRAAHAVAIRHARGEADTEDLRRAIVNYRNLFDELANDRGDVRAAE
jgi:hypothetical protein